MRKHFIFVFIVLCFSINAEDYHVYNLSIVKTFNTGSGQYELGYNEKVNAAQVEPGPYGFGFLETGELVISDRWNNRLVIYEPDLNTNSILHFDYSDEIISVANFESSNNGYISGYSGIVDYGITDKTGNFNVNLDFYHTPYTEQIVIRNTFFFNNIVFCYLKNGDLISIPDPVYDRQENNQKILDSKATIRLFESDSGFDLDGLTIDESNRLFLDGELQTRDYKTFFNYWVERNNDIKKSGNATELSLNPDIFSVATKFIGKDSNGNYYWNDRKAVIIFNKYGDLIDIFLTVQPYSQFTPAVHPSGEVYFLDYDEEEVRLYKVSRVW